MNVVRSIARVLAVLAVLFGLVLVLVGLIGTTIGLPSRRGTPGGCPNCGYDLSGLPERSCPECGWNRTREPGRRATLRFQRLGDEDRLMSLGVGLVLAGILALVLVV